VTLRETQTHKRILHCPRNIGGHSSAVSRAEQSLGAYSRLILLEAERYGFDADEILTGPGDSAYARWRAKVRLLTRAAHEFDVVHFNGGQPLFAPPPPWFWAGMSGPMRSRLAYAALESLSHLAPFADLKRLRNQGKILCVTFQGDDARLGAPQRARYTRSLATEADGPHYSSEGDRWKSRRVAAFNQYTHLIYALNPDLLHADRQGRGLPETRDEIIGDLKKTRSSQQLRQDCRTRSRRADDEAGRAFGWPGFVAQLSFQRFKQGIELG